MRLSSILRDSIRSGRAGSGLQSGVKPCSVPHRVPRARFSEHRRRQRSRRSAQPVVGLVKEWQIIGPFEGKSRSQLKDFAPAFAKDAKWKLITKGFEPNRIDIQANIGEHDDCSAFVRTTIISPKKQTVSIRLTADDLIAGVLNGRLIKGNRIELKKGKNDLLLKVIDHKKGWRFTCAITKNGKIVPGLGFAAD